MEILLYFIEWYIVYLCVFGSIYGDGILWPDK